VGNKSGRKQLSHFVSFIVGKKRSSVIGKWPKKTGKLGEQSRAEHRSALQWGKGDAAEYQPTT
jgi:hypothetical protein